MFKQMFNSLSILLQGTVFQRKPQKAALNKSVETHWAYDPDGAEKCAPPYVITTEEWRVRRDPITRWHSVENELQRSREQSRLCRAKWFIELYEQIYYPKAPSFPDPQVEVYYRSLGLNIAREPRVSMTGLSR